MNSSRNLRRIASNRLWTAEGWMRNPLVEIDDIGIIVAIEQWSEGVDRMPFVEFYAGALIPSLSSELDISSGALHGQIDSLRHSSIEVGSKASIWLLWGLDYESMELTVDSQWRVLI